MEKLRRQLDELLNRLKRADEIQRRLQELVSVYPFSEFEYIISHLLAARKLTLEEYYELRSSYIDRNLYLYLFEISAPRGYGEAWAQGQLKELVPALQRPSRKIDPDYSGQYDFVYPPRIRIEVKASRAVESGKDEPLYIKALSSDSEKPFDMNLQQIKPSCCDAFVWLAAWRDMIRYWVISSSEVENNRTIQRDSIAEMSVKVNFILPTKTSTSSIDILSHRSISNGRFNVPSRKKRICVLENNANVA